MSIIKTACLERKLITGFVVSKKGKGFIFLLALGRISFSNLDKGVSDISKDRHPPHSQLLLSVGILQFSLRPKRGISIPVQFLGSLYIDIKNLKIAVGSEGLLGPQELRTNQYSLLSFVLPQPTIATA